jgi:hypothetical protein
MARINTLAANLATQTAAVNGTLVGHLAFAALLATSNLANAARFEEPTHPAPNATATIRLPAQIQAQPGQPFAVVAEGNLKWMRWTIPSGLTRVPPELTACGDKGFVGYGPAGVYEFRCEGTLNDQFAEAKCVVFVGQPSPLPPGPNPGPPPVPPPGPPDALAAELQKLFTADKGDTLHRDKLCELWRSAIPQVSDNPDYSTLKDFAAAMHAAAGKYPFSLHDTDLAGVRRRLATELDATCGAGASLGVPGSKCRKDAAAVLDRFAGALAGVK